MLPLMATGEFIALFPYLQGARQTPCISAARHEQPAVDATR